MSETSKCKNYILNIYTGVHVGTFKGHSSIVTKICTFKPEDKKIVSVSLDKNIIIWKLEEEGEKITGSVISKIVGHNKPISDCTLSTYSWLLSTCSLGKTVKLWDLNAEECQQTFIGHTDQVLCVSFDEDQQRIISGSKDKSVRLWDVYSDEKWTNTTAHSCPVTCVTSLPDRPSSTFISASEMGDILQWDLYRFISYRQYTGQIDRINSISVSVDSTKMIVGGEDEEVTIWEIGCYKRHEQFKVDGVVRSVTISPLYYICAIGEEEKIQMYHFCSYDPYQTLIPQDINSKKPPKVTTLCWSNDSKYLYAGYTDGKIRVFRFKKFYIPWHKSKFKHIRSGLYR